MARLINAAIFASGTGSNALNILEFAKEHPIEIKTLVTDNPDAKIVKSATQLGIPVFIAPIERERFSDYSHAKKDQEEKIIKYIKEFDVNWIFLAGYMKILSNQFLHHFYDEELDVCRVINIHPSLLPCFPGADGYGDAFKSGTKISGATIHFVDDGVDTGPIIDQISFPRLDSDTLEDFKARGIKKEHKLYRRALEKLIYKNLRLEDIQNGNKRMVHIED